MFIIMSMDLNGSIFSLTPDRWGRQVATFAEDGSVARIEPPAMGFRTVEHARVFLSDHFVPALPDDQMIVDSYIATVVPGGTIGATFPLMAEGRVE